MARQMGHWPNILNYVGDNTVEHIKDSLSPIVANLWRRILALLNSNIGWNIKHIKDNQLAIVYQLTELKPNAAKLKHWVEIIGGQSVDTSWQR